MMTCTDMVKMDIKMGHKMAIKWPILNVLDIFGLTESGNSQYLTYRVGNLFEVLSIFTQELGTSLPSFRMGLQVRYSIRSSEQRGKVKSKNISCKML